MEHVPGRSINLAMSVRGLSALNTIGLGKDIFINGRNTQIAPILKGGWGRTEKEICLNLSKMPNNDMDAYIVSLGPPQ